MYVGKRGKELSKNPVELCNTTLKKEQWFDVKDGIHKNRSICFARLC